MALQRIGPRRNNILFALAAPFTVLLNIVLLNEVMSLLNLIGCIGVFCGVVIAIMYGRTKNNEHRWEMIEGSLSIGILMGISSCFMSSYRINNDETYFSIWS